MFRRWGTHINGIVVFAHKSLASGSLSPGGTDFYRFEPPVAVGGIELGNRESMRSKMPQKLLVLRKGAE
jgi:hypothetical protein